MNVLIEYLGVDMSSAGDCLAALGRELNRAASANLGSLSASELLQVRSSIASLRRGLDALDHRVIAVGARKDLHRAAGASSINELIATTNGVSRKEAAKSVKLAQHLEKSPVLAQQMHKPGMSPVKAQLITEAVAKLPDDLTVEQKQHIEHELALAAPGMSVEQFKRQAKRALETIDPPRANQIENDELTISEETALRRASFWMTRPDADGMVKGGFEIDAFTADMLRSVLESKTAPRYRTIQQRNTATKAGGMTQAGEKNPAGGKNQAGGMNQSSLVDQSNNAPGFKETQGEAFIEILRHLPRDAYGNHGGVAATLMVTISEESLRERSTAAGITEHGTAVSVGQLRQLACNARILPAVLGSKSQILDVGREQRLHTPAQRKALAHRDGGCAFPSCERPPGWCETHHITSWANGGDTTIENGVLLCGYHHRHIHNSNWRIETNPRDKHPDFYPPGKTVPIRNTRYQPLVA